MKSGMIRRVDSLGRIVIPKEIRKVLKIKENEQVEINVLEKEIILSKYSEFSDYDLSLKKLVDLISDIYKIDILITDLSNIKITSKNYMYLENKELSLKLLSVIENREDIKELEKSKIRICNDCEDLESSYIIKNIIINGDCLGLIVFLTDYEMDLKVIELVSTYLEKYLE